MSNIPQPTPAKINVLRTEMRKGKIIIVLEPELLSNQVFAVNPYYDEGDEKNKLQYVRIALEIKEDNGKIQVESCNYKGFTYTTSHRQMTDPNNLYLSKRDRAISELLNLDIEYINDIDRIDKLLGLWTDDPAFKSHLVDIISYRKELDFSNRLKNAMEKQQEASDEIKGLLSEFKTNEP
jgi:hypothetical protein